MKKIILLIVIMCVFAVTVFAVDMDIKLLHGQAQKQTVGAYGSNYDFRVLSGATPICSSGVVNPGEVINFNCAAISSGDTTTYTIDHVSSWSTNLYRGAIKENDFKILTDMYDLYQVHIKVELTGVSKAGQRIVITNEAYYNELDNSANFDADRIALIGYTDNDGVLEAWLTNHRFTKVYLNDQTSENNLIFATQTQDNILEDNYYYISYDVDNHASSSLMSFALTDGLTNFESFTNVKKPIRVKNSGGTTLCQGSTREINGKNMYNGNYNFMKCRINHGQKITVERNHYQDNTNWAHSNSGLIYDANFNGEGRIVTDHYKPNTQEFSVDLDGTSIQNKKIIIKDVSDYNVNNIDEPNRIDVIGYTDSTGQASFRLRELKHYKVYIDDAASESNLIWSGVVWSEDTNFYDNYHMIKYNVDESVALIDISTSGNDDYTTSDSNRYPVRVKQGGTVVCQALTRGYNDISGASCRVNTGHDYTVERSYDGDITSWADPTSGTVFDGYIGGHSSIFTHHIQTQTQKVTVDLGSSMVHELVTVYDISDNAIAAGSFNDRDVNRITCKGYTDSNGVFECRPRYRRHIEIYLGDRSTGTRLYESLDFYDYDSGSKYDVVYKNHNLGSSYMLRVNDRTQGNAINVDTIAYQPVRVYSDSGELVCSGTTLLDTNTNKSFECLLPNDQIFWVFSMQENERNPDIHGMYLIYRGKIFGDTLVETAHNGQYSENALVEVYVEHLENLTSVVDRKVELKLDNGETVCKGWTDSTGRVLCQAWDDVSRTISGDRYKPRYNIDVLQSVSDISIQLFHIADYGPSTSSLNLPSDYGSNYAISIPGRVLRVSKTRDGTAAAPAVYLRSTKVTIGSGSSLDKATLKVYLLDESSAIIQGEDVSLYRAGTDTGETQLTTDVEGKVVFTDIDPYYSYDVRTQYGERINIYLQPDKTTTVTIRKSSTSGSGDAVETRESRPSLLTLSGELKNRTTGNSVSTASFRVKIGDKLDDIWYDFATDEGFCFSDKVYRGEFGFIIGGQNPLFLIQDKLYNMNIDIFLGITCIGTPEDSFTTYFKG